MRKEGSSENIFLKEEVEITKAIEYGQLSHQLIDLLQPRKNEDLENYIKRIASSSKFTQIAPEVKDFFINFFESKKHKQETSWQEDSQIDKEELFYFLVALLTTPKPREQKALLDEYREFLTSPERGQVIKKEIFSPLNLNLIQRVNKFLEEVEENSLKRWDLLRWLEANKISPQSRQIREVLWPVIEKIYHQMPIDWQLKLLSFLTPEEREFHKSLIKKTINSALERKEKEQQVKESLCSFLAEISVSLTPEEKIEYRKIAKEYADDNYYYRMITKLNPFFRRKKKKNIGIYLKKDKEDYKRC